MKLISAPSRHLLLFVELAVLSLGLTSLNPAWAQETLGEPTLAEGQPLPTLEPGEPEEQVLLGEQGEGELIIDGGVYNSPVVAYTENVQAWWFSTADFCEFGGQTFPPSGEGPLGTYPPGSYSATFSCTYLTPTF